MFDVVIDLALTILIAHLILNKGLLGGLTGRWGVGNSL
jgi:hypothetical protein